MTLVKFNRPQRGNTPVMQTLFDELFHSFPTLKDYSEGNNLPAVNVSESENAYSIELSAPGFNKEEFSIEVDNNNLIIIGEKKNNAEVTEKNYTRKEFSYVNFKRSFNLPENANNEAIDGNYNNGVLHIEIPKLKVEQKTTKKIELK